ncbi:molecular chaperone [Pseudomonas sp. GCM10022186]|uniref:fimbrial biogenesis chaperone n=1 Tax=Pseudomonas sp. GCM10022186 TaxID=3252650 RepID=UPI0036105B3E
MSYRLSSKILLGCCLLLASSLAAAGITLGSTRVVLSAPAKEASVLVKNQANQDIMIQSWIEDESATGKQDVPFAITPALSRLGGGKQQNLRILYYGQGLPTDQESMFRLNVQEIPQKAKSENTLQIALRQRIKLFYRPAGLPGKVEDAPAALEWRVTGRGLEVSNASPFHVSFGQVKFISAGKSYDVNADMAAPKSTLQLSIKNFPGNTSGPRKVEFETINDYGGIDRHTSEVAN